MKELLETYNLQQIAIFIVLLAAAIKGAVSWIEWAKEKISKKFEGKNETAKVREEFRKDIEDLKLGTKEVCDKIDKLADRVNLLMESDKDDIKAYITREHHYFVYKLGYIDDYNLDCIERRYAHYKEEGGNSFIADLMAEIRALPKKNSVALYSKEEEDSKELKDNNRE